MTIGKKTRKFIWWALMIGISLPLLWILFQWALAVDEGFGLGYLTSFGFHKLTANPIEFTNRYLGDWGLRFLILSLAVTPSARIFKFPQLISYRRMIGLWAFTYVACHVSSYVILDQFFDWGAIWRDILKRNYITLGMTALTLLIPMALTSTKGWIKRLGSKTWKNIHKAIYVIAPLAAFHYQFMIKGNQVDPKIYIGIVAFLLGIRVWFFWDDKRKTAAKRAAA